MHEDSFTIQYVMEFLEKSIGECSWTTATEADCNSRSEVAQRATVVPSVDNSRTGGQNHHKFRSSGWEIPVSYLLPLPFSCLGNEI